MYMLSEDLKIYASSSMEIVKYFSKSVSLLNEWVYIVYIKKINLPPSEQNDSIFGHPINKKKTFTPLPAFFRIHRGIRKVSSGMTGWE